METLEVKYKSAKLDIQDAWDNPVRNDDRVTRNWIYSVDPETMVFCKVVFPLVDGDMSLYDVFTSIMKYDNFHQFKTRCIN